MMQNEMPTKFGAPDADQFRKKKFNLKALIAIAAVVVIACSSFLIVNEIQKNKLQKKLILWKNWNRSMNHGNHLLSRFFCTSFTTTWLSTVPNFSLR